MREFCLFTWRGNSESDDYAAASTAFRSAVSHIGLLDGVRLTLCSNRPGARFRQTRATKQTDSLFSSQLVADAERERQAGGALAVVAATGNTSPVIKGACPTVPRVILKGHITNAADIADYFGYARDEGQDKIFREVITLAATATGSYSDLNRTVAAYCRLFEGNFAAACSIPTGGWWLINVWTPLYARRGLPPGVTLISTAPPPLTERHWWQPFGVNVLGVFGAAAVTPEPIPIHVYRRLRTPPWPAASRP